MTRTRRIVRIAGGVLGALVALLLLGLFGASLKASARLERQFDVHHVELAVPNPLNEQELSALRSERATPGSQTAGADPLADLDLNAIALERAIARGKHLVEARYACAACHGANLAGGVMMDEPPIGVIKGPNLTRGKGGLPADYSMADWDRIVRHGIKRDGKPAVMPSEDFFVMTDHELSDIVAYVRSLPPVDAEIPQPSFGPLGKVLLALDKFPLAADKLTDHRRAHGLLPPAAADTAEFGAHLAATCTGCHRDNLAGGPMPFGPPDWPAAANLTQDATGLDGWSFADFERALTQGIRKNGQALREPMTHVLPGTRAMTNVERKALWRHLTAVPAHPTNP